MEENELWRRGYRMMVGERDKSNYEKDYKNRNRTRNKNKPRGGISKSRSWNNSKMAKNANR